MVHASHEPANDPASAALKARIRRSRLNMLVGHIPSATLMAAVLAVLIVILVASILPGPLTRATQAWLGITVLASVARSAHAMAYRRSTDQDARHWRLTFVGLTLVFGLCWGSLIWVLPLDEHVELSAAIVGTLIGITSTGVSMVNMDRITARTWLISTLLPCSAFAGLSSGPLGWFGFITVSGFGVILWLEANRAHRRMDEVLRLRYESEQLAQAREQALQEAESLSAAKGRFLATMSHEMRTPLHGILGLSRMLRTELSSSDAHAQMNLLQNAGEHLLCVINDVLDFSRLKEGHLTLKPAPVALNKLVRDVCQLADVNAQDKGLVVSLQSALPDELWVEADAERLKQILINLVGNAVKFTDQGHVIVRLRPASQSPQGKIMVVFEVEDTGSGIPADELTRIFDAFHQVDARDERKAGGSGLGLSIAQQLCKAMHGDIRCESRLGIGSTFRFALPLPCVDGAHVHGSPHAPHAAPLKEPEVPLFGTVLLVEDNPVNALVAQAALEKLGLHVHLAENGQHALDWLSQHKADLILMDCHMPQMGGIEATRRIRASEKQRGLSATPIVAMSASNQPEDHRQCLAVGMDDFIAKPFIPSEMARVLRRHLQQRTPRAKRVTRRGLFPHQARSAIQLP